MWRWICGCCLALCATVACSAGNDTISEEHSFTDGAGRSCRAVLEKTSVSAPSLSDTVSCDSGTRQCSAESKPCFQLSVDNDSGEVRNCPACCQGTASSFTSSDCSPLVCNTDADCVFARAQCVGGACTCENGICE
ncbi:MAG TPA: hypothetical protein VEQ59_23810 [Polyangiaceae bacterium]|nr:hypothetical protein [Polyangiaceae bacterium]